MAIGQDHSKFFTAVARQCVHGAHTFNKALGNCLQHVVSGDVTMGVIDLFEVVDVQH